MHIRHGGCNAQAGACTLWRGLLNKSPKNMKPAACALFYLLLQGKAESPWSGESAPNTFCKDTNVPTAYRATFGTLWEDQASRDFITFRHMTLLPSKMPSPYCITT